MILIYTTRKSGSRSINGNPVWYVLERETMTKIFIRPFVVIGKFKIAVKALIDFQNQLTISTKK